MTDKNTTNYNWVLLLIALGLAVWLYLKKDGTKPAEPVPAEVAHDHDHPHTAPVQPQYSEHNPKPQSLDPFTINDNFEFILTSNQNKTDFDFYFASQEETPTYKIENGVINFELIGQVKSKTELENNVSLTLEIYDNDQVSFTKRSASSTFDLPYVKETMERASSKDKLLYTFDFQKKMTLSPGLYYFTIIPTGRNRVLYADKFFVKNK